MKLKSICVKLQSAVDVITNSSTSIYTIAGNGTINSIKDIINTTLQIGGSSQTADDLFTIELTDPSYYNDDSFIEACRDYVVEHVLSEEEYEIWEKNGADEELDNLTTSEIKSIVNRKYNPYEYYSRGYKIIPKQNIENHQKLADLLSNLQNLFNIEASYD